MSDELELAWAAGFFDGEGTTVVITVKPKRGVPSGYMHLHMKVGQVERQPLERFHKALGIGSVTGPYGRGLPENWNPVYVWQAGGTPSCKQALELLWPYLSEPKRRQATAAIERVDTRPELLRVQRKRRIVSLKAQGLTVPEIAQAVGLSRRAIQYHLRTAGEEVS